jgi:hypothetical protein
MVHHIKNYKYILFTIHNNYCQENKSVKQFYKHDCKALNMHILENF